MQKKIKLPLSFYRTEDTLSTAKQLLGKFLFTKIDGFLTGGMIIETEAYLGIEDKASHAYNGRFTPRTQTMYENGGISYVYMCYGMHCLLNAVTNKKNIPHAVLIRALKPTEGLDIMEKRRNTALKHLASGPGSLCKALGITKEHNKLKLNGNVLWIEDKKIAVHPHNIIKTPRIGVAYAGDHALLPLRFFLAK